MFCQRFLGVRVMALATAALALSSDLASAGGTYRSPPPKTRSSSAERSSRQTPHYLPPGAPLDRTYTWYAPPEGYEVVMEGTPSAPLMVTVTGPDGRQRTYRLEGPVVMRPSSYVVRRAGR